MFFLIFTICTSVAMGDCQEQTLPKPFTTERRCEQAADIYRAALGPADNYRITCEREKQQ